LTQKPVEVFQTNIDTPKAGAKEEKIVFELIEEELEIPTVATTTAIDDNELIAMNQFIRNLDVTFEIVSPIMDIDYKVTTPEVREMKVVEPQNIIEEEQITFTFDMPAATPVFEKVEVVEAVQPVEETKIVFDLSEANDIVVNEPVQFVPVTELNEGGVIKYSLEEYMELENDLLNSKPAAKTVVEEPIAEELNITMKVETEKPQAVNYFDEVSPVEMTIEETLKHRADERRRKLKEFNYKFHNNPSRIEELEKEPAYKRLGVDLSNNADNSSNSRMSLGTDSNDDLQIRTNNSFLHDNVD
jgi:cell division protein FtsZ